jgi:uncharacterized protein YfaS (alpha-2-macroglobulin family)
LVCLSFNSQSQINSVDVNITFTSEIDSTLTDSLGNHILADVMNVNVNIDDVDYMGEVMVTLYEGGTNFPMGIMKMTAQDFIDKNLKVGNTVTVKLFGVDPTIPCSIETQVRNFQGANLPVVTTNYSL